MSKIRESMVCDEGGDGKEITKSKEMANFVYVKDNAGKTIKFREMEGRRYPDFCPDSLKHVTEMEARPDDILLITYPKAGTHWVFQIVRYLLAGTTDLPTVEKDDYMIEQVARDFINELPSDVPRNLNTHYHADVISPDFLRKKSKIIYVTRNPRDIATSYFNHHSKLGKFYEFQGEWNDYLPMFIEGKLDYDCWFEHSKGWEKCIKDHPDNPSLVLSYEGLKQDALGNTKKIADFLGTSHSEEFLKEVVVKTSFDSMAAARKAEMKIEEDMSYMFMYRKGKVGDWKNQFTVAQSEIFNDIFEKKMAGTEAYKLYSHTVQKEVDDNKNV